MANHSVVDDESTYQVSLLFTSLNQSNAQVSSVPVLIRPVSDGLMPKSIQVFAPYFFS